MSIEALALAFALIIAFGVIIYSSYDLMHTKE